MGLLDNFSLQGLLSDPYLRFGVNLMAAGGPSKQPHSFGQDLQNAMQTTSAEDDQDFRRKMQEMQFKQAQQAFESQQALDSWASQNMDKIQSLFSSPQPVPAPVGQPMQPTAAQGAGAPQPSPLNIPAAYAPLIDKVRKAYPNLPANLIPAMIQKESAWNPMAKGPDVQGANGVWNAQGLGQFNPDTAKQYGVDPWNAESSAMGMGKYLSDLLAKNNGDMTGALAQYGGGYANGQPTDNGRAYAADVLQRAGIQQPPPQPAPQPMPQQAGGFAPADQRFISGQSVMPDLNLANIIQPGTMERLQALQTLSKVSNPAISQPAAQQAKLLMAQIEAQMKGAVDMQTGQALAIQKQNLENQSTLVNEKGPNGETIAVPRSEVLKRGGVVTEMSPQDKAFGEAQGKVYSDRLKAAQETAYGAAVGDKLANLDLMEQMVNDPNTYTGPFGDSVATGQAILQAMGAEKLSGDATPAQVLKALQSKLTLDLNKRSADEGGRAMPGNFSDADREFLKLQTAGIDKNKNANRLLIGYSRLGAMREQEIAQKAIDYSDRHDGKIDSGFFKEIKTWKDANPVFGVNVPADPNQLQLGQKYHFANGSVAVWNGKGFDPIIDLR